MVVVALLVALFTILEPVEVVLFFLVPVTLEVTASAAAAAATPVTAVRTDLSTFEAILFFAFLAFSFASFSASLAARASSLAWMAACFSASAAASISAFWRSASSVADGHSGHTDGCD